MATTTNVCDTGFSDLAPTASGNTDATGSGTATTGNCQYCASTYFAPNSMAVHDCLLTATVTNVCDAGYSDVAPVAGVNSAATGSGTATTGNCEYCAPDYFSDGADACIDSSANTNDCATGYWYDAGYTADVTACVNAAADCATGYASDSTVSSGSNCAACDTGYSFDATNTTQCVADAPAAANSKLLATSIAVIASIIMIVF